MLKIRIANLGDKDFTEVDLDKILCHCVAMSLTLKRTI